MLDAVLRKQFQVQHYNWSTGNQFYQSTCRTLELQTNLIAPLHGGAKCIRGGKRHLQRPRRRCLNLPWLPFEKRINIMVEAVLKQHFQVRENNLSTGNRFYQSTRRMLILRTNLTALLAGGAKCRRAGERHLHRAHPRFEAFSGHTEFAQRELSSGH